MGWYDKRRGVMGGQLIYFTSDTHFNHDNIIKYSSRPFSTLEEMTEAYIQRWNDIVRPGDSVYHLGDFAISYGKRHEKLVDDLLARLKGQKFLIKGNHDRKEVVDNPRWAAVYDYKEIKVDRGGVHKQRIVLFHYPLRSWNQVHRGAWHLHGHCHGNLPQCPGKHLDVGMDAAANHRLLSLDEVAHYMESRQIHSEDHHIPEE
jgi:calcineurin-like phosphoesterase family protein